MAGKGILLNEDFDILIAGKSLVIGDSEMQETATIIQMNQGEHKTVPVLGPNIVQLIKGNASTFDIEQRVRLHLAKDGKDYQKLKNKIETLQR